MEKIYSAKEDRIECFEKLFVERDVINSTADY